jgi:DNA polymerase-1
VAYERATVTDSPLAHVSLRLVDSLDTALALKRWLSERRDTPLGLDTETGGLIPHQNRLRLVQIGDKNTGWAIPWELWGGVALEVMRAWEGQWVLHNTPFDARFLKLHGGWDMPWDRVDDTMTMTHLDDPTRPRGLKPASEILVDPLAGAGQSILHDAMKANGWTWETVPSDFPAYWVYGALDPVLTCHMWDKTKYVLEQFAHPYQIEMNAARICTDMMMRGVRVDVPYIERGLSSLRQYAAGARDWLAEACGVTSPNSSAQLARLFDEHGKQILFYTDGGAPSFDKDALAYYADVYPDMAPIVGTVRDIRRSEKTIGTYLENFLRLRDGDDLLHPSINPLAAKTSRMSCSDPNLQNLTRDDKIVRGSIIPREGNVFVAIDAAQIEMRLAAHFSRDPGLIEAFRVADSTGGDFFSIMASEIFAQEISKKDPRRQRTKNTSYAKNYGASTATMAATAGVPVDVMQAFHLALNESYPGLNRYLESIIAQARRQSHHGMPAIFTPSGRRLLSTPGKEYALGNFNIQCTAAEVLKEDAYKLDRAGLGEFLVLPVHDEFLLDAPADMAADVLHEAERILEDRETYAVPLLWEGEIMTDRWKKG